MTIDEIKARNPIVELIGRSVELKQKGRYLMGCCPFHEDSNPSFSVSEETGYYVCFGCGSSGDVIDWVCQTQKVDKREAVRQLSGSSVGEYKPRTLIKPKPPKPVSRELKDGYESLRAETTEEAFTTLAATLGIPKETLMSLGFAWSKRKHAWMTPMRDANTEIIGFQFRSESAKWMLTGSRLGLFLPSMPIEKTLYVTEGASDCASVLSLGLFAIGKPSAMGGMDLCVDYVKKWKIESVVICADNDEAKLNQSTGEFVSIGFAGATKLSERLVCKKRVFIPPEKDMRSWVRKEPKARMILEAEIIPK
jgi:DNA primase